MTDPQALSVENLSEKDRRELDRLSRHWQKKLKPQRDAIRESQRITAEDLALRIGPVHED
jgi:hypothetical protein